MKRKRKRKKSLGVGEMMAAPSGPLYGPGNHRLSERKKSTITKEDVNKLKQKISRLTEMLSRLRDGEILVEELSNIQQKVKDALTKFQTPEKEKELETIKTQEQLASSVDLNYITFMAYIYKLRHPDKPGSVNPSEELIKLWERVQPLYDAKFPPRLSKEDVRDRIMQALTTFQNEEIKTQEQLARSVDMTPQTFSRYINKLRNPNSPVSLSPSAELIKLWGKVQSDYDAKFPPMLISTKEDVRDRIMQALNKVLNNELKGIETQGDLANSVGLETYLLSKYIIKLQDPESRYRIKIPKEMQDLWMKVQSDYNAKFNTSYTVMQALTKVQKGDLKGITTYEQLANSVGLVYRTFNRYIEKLRNPKSTKIKETLSDELKKLWDEVKDTFDKIFTGKISRSYKPQDLLINLTNLTSETIQKTLNENELCPQQLRDLTGQVIQARTASNIEILNPDTTITWSGVATNFCEILHPIAVKNGWYTGNGMNAIEKFLGTNNLSRATINFPTETNNPLFDSEIQINGKSLKISSKNKNAGGSSLSGIDQLYKDIETSENETPLENGTESEIKDLVSRLKKPNGKKIEIENWAELNDSEAYDIYKNEKDNEQLKKQLSVFARKMCEDYTKKYGPTLANILNRGAIIQVNTNAELSKDKWTLNKFNTIWPSTAVANVVFKWSNGKITFKLLENSTDQTTQTSPVNEDRDLAIIKKLAGITTDDSALNNGSNITVTAAEKARLMKEHNIKPGTPEWFKLWFARPYMTNEKPIG